MVLEQLVIHMQKNKTGLLSYTIHKNYKKELSTDTCYNMGEPWKHYAKWKKSVTKDQIFYDFIHKKRPE